MTQMQSAARREGGMALIVGLIMLLSLTLLGLAAIQNTSLEERMAGNLRSENMALQSAEAALRGGESWLGAMAQQPAVVSDGPGATGGDWVWAGTLSESTYRFTNLCSASERDPDVDPRFNSAAFWWLCWDSDDWEAFGRAVDAGLTYASGQRLGYKDATTVDPATAPFFVVEEDRLVKDSLNVGQQRDYSGRFFYDITGRGVDAGGRAEVLLRAGYARRY